MKLWLDKTMSSYKYEYYQGNALMSFILNEYWIAILGYLPRPA